MQSVCELSSTAQPYSQKLGYSKVSYSGGLRENRITLSPCLKLSLQSPALRGLVIQRGEPGCCSQPQTGATSPGKGAGEQGRRTEPFGAPFHTKPHIFLTPTCSLLLMVRLLGPSLGSDT